MHSFLSVLRRFRDDERGVFLVIFALLAVVLIATSGAVVDFTRVQQARTRAQTALDAATLALQAQIATQTEAQLMQTAQALLDERLADPTVEAEVTSVVKALEGGRLHIQASLSVPTSFVQLVGVRSINAHLESEVTRGSSDLEVSVSLDVTGSMVATYDRWGRETSNKLGDLKAATNTLIDLLVMDAQTPTYSKMAIVPWSGGVNVGSNAGNVRGTPNTATITITGASWASGSSQSINRVTRGRTTTFRTNNNHGFNTGDTVYLSGLRGLSRNNGSPPNFDGVGFVVTRVSSTEFSVEANTSNHSNWTSGGTATKCQVANCEMVITANRHGYANGAPIRIEGANWLRNKGFFANNVTANTMSLINSYGPSEGNYSSGGRIWCAHYGCSYRTFYTAAGGINSFAASNCVSERTTSAFTDAAPNTTRLGFNYASSGNGCIDKQIVPLTANKATLKSLVNGLVAEGSTAGHLGLAWGWYMISPSFGYLWPSASQPAAYGRTNLLKAVVFMTDGDFNTPYCDGVISADALTGSGATSDHINCNAPNGASRYQAEQLCTAIKAPANKTVLFTVGFDLASNSAALSFLEDCASGPEYFYQADTGADLTQAFRSIAQSLSDLRISR